MKKFYPFLIASLTIITSTTLVAQEKVDSSRIATDNNSTISSFGRTWSFDYPTSVEPKISFDETNDTTILGKKWLNRVNYSNHLFSFPGEDKSDFTYTSDIFNFHALSDPFTINLDFHTKPILGWKKFDIYFFGNAIFENRYTINRQGIYDDGAEYKRDLLWEIGSGIEYEYRESKFLFYDYSQFYENKGILTGKVKDFSQGMHKGGFRYKF